jgi:alpha-1,3-glucosyltransferase
MNDVLQWLMPLSPSSQASRQVAFVMLVHFVLRVLVALSPHSGQGQAPRWGDFEAQRHWMEVTRHVPLSDWYAGRLPGNELTHWGLDYPPLTAAVSWLHGAAIELALGSSNATLALGTSRGAESDAIKLAMRLSVLLSECLVLWPAVVVFVTRVVVPRADRVAATVALVLFQPSLILIDHGHFQYNTICLGLTLWAVVALLADRPYLATVCFCAALNFKHMALYFAPAFFFQMLGDAARLGSPARAARRVALLGVVAVATFAAIWSPWLAQADPLAAVQQVLARLLPWERGLFEDKVANFWCTVSPVLKLNGRYPIATLRQLCLGATLLAIAPASAALLLRRRSRRPRARAEAFLAGLLATSLAFFLFSYQVHEKSLLLPLLPLALLAASAAPRWRGIAALVALVGHFSMYPLSQKDETQLAYFALAVLYYLAEFGGAAAGRHAWFVALSAGGAIGIHLLMAFATPPARLPDLFTVACTSFAFLHLAVLWLVASARLWQMDDSVDVDERDENDDDEIKRKKS